MPIDDRLFNRTVPEANAWRIRRVTGETNKIGPFLSFGRFENGEDANEWVIDQFSGETILDRWGEGRYTIELYQVDTNGARGSKGRSKYFEVDADGQIGLAEPAPKPMPQGYRAPESSANPPAHPPAPEAVTPPAMVAPIPLSSLVDGDMMKTLQLMRFLTDMGDKRAERAIEAERASAQRAIEAERTSAMYRLQQQEQFYGAMLQMLKKEKPPLGAEDIARIVRETVREELDSLEDDEPAPAPVANEGNPATRGDAAIIASAIENVALRYAPMLSRFTNGAGNGGAGPGPNPE